MQALKLTQIIVLEPFRRQAKRLKIAGLEEAAVDAVKKRSMGGVLIPGSGGLRKLRIALPGRGKRGGARVLYCLKVVGSRAYLLGVLSKNQQEDFSPEFLKAMSELAKQVE